MTGPLWPVQPSQVPGLAELRDLFNKAKIVISPVDFLIQLGSIDCDRLRRAGGKGGWGDADGYVFKTLDGDGGVVEDIDEWRGRLKEHWNSPAVRGADAHLAKAVSNLRHEAKFVPQIGAQLTDLADVLELSFLDIASVVLATAALVVAVPSVVLAEVAVALEVGTAGAATPLTIAGLVVAIVGAILAAAAYVVAYYASLKPRIDALAKADGVFEKAAAAKNTW